jgi:glycine/D-amino acid oxidase-like deaminating enzyme
MSTHQGLTSDFKTTPYWWEGVPRDEGAEALPERADVVVVGAGLTGCSAAATLAAGGRDVVVVESEWPGFGASTRNGSFIGRHFKHSLADLLKRFDVPTALSYFYELRRAFDFTIDLIKSEQLDCSLQENGRFIAAMSVADFERLKIDYALRREHMDENFELLPDGGASEYRSARVVGGVLLPGQASIHPGFYAHAMAGRAKARGARIVSQTTVTGLRQADDGFEVATSRGTIRCRDVLMATNGYSGAAMPWLKRRLIPIKGFMIATEPLPAGMLPKLLPHNRTYTDIRKDSNYLRWSPDGTRLILGGQTGANLENRLDVLAGRLRAEMIDLFPELEGTRIAHGWTGRCATTFDVFPKIGKQDGVHFALAYCFSGNALGPYLGYHAALRILGQPSPELAFEARRFPSMPFYTGNSWFVPYIQRYHKLVDRLRR